jgi:hypothetical protein
VIADLTVDQLRELGELFEEHRDAGQSPVDAAIAFITRLHLIREANKSLERVQSRPWSAHRAFKSEGR